MKLLLRPFGGLRCRGLPPFLQSRPCSSIDPVPNRHRMQTLTHAAAPASNPSGLPEAADLRWVILDHWAIPKGSSVNVVADDKTAAECRTSSGRPFRISLGTTAPPAISFMCVDPAGDRRSRNKAVEFADKNVYVIAAHGDSVLFRRRRVPQPRQRLDSYRPSDGYFVYRAVAGGRPPSLSLLPSCSSIPMIERDCDGEYGPTARELDQADTGILRCGDDEILVAQLKIAHAAPFDTAELCLLLPGRTKWELKTAVPIVHNNGNKRHDLLMWQETHVAVPPKDEEEDFFDDHYEEQLPWLYYRSIGAVCPEIVRFISINNRCCCGAHVIRSSCEHSSSAFMVAMWSLALRTAEPMKWVKEAVLDCEELWSLAACKGLPRVHLTCPVVSMENPDVVCFMAKEGDMLWTVDIDMRRKSLISAMPCPPHPVKCINYCNPLPAKLHGP
ncbi:unnamed protein product [Urochloa decumbens]|uniref:DUF1618 domain-containing protein n=1 Tax=Urochloa decumbens TaxID=240449 RepID=A0ABC9B9S9_9POAL